MANKMLYNKDKLIEEDGLMVKTSRLNKEIVIECAMDLVSESGISGLRLNKIADRLEVKSPSLYTHTGSVMELRCTVISRAMDQFREKLVDSLLGRADLCAFVELGKTWAAYAKEQSAFYTVFYKIEYMDMYEKNVSKFLQTAFARIFGEYPLTTKETVQIERIMTSYFRGHQDCFANKDFTEADLVSDLEIIYSGIHQHLEKVSQKQ